MNTVIINGVEYRLQVVYEPSGAAREYGALAVNLAIGCRYGCRYCYGPASAHMAAEEFHNMPRFRDGVLENLEKDCAALPAGQHIFMEFLSDPFFNRDKAELTRAALGIIHKHGHFADVLTKGHLEERDMASLVPGDLFGHTMVFRSAVTQAVMEPYAASPMARMHQLCTMHDRGIRTFVSMEPVMLADEALGLIPLLAPYVDEFRVGKINHLERVKWPSEDWRRKVERVDWADFTRRAIEALNKTGRSYLIKESLREYLPEGAKPVATASRYTGWCGHE